MGRHRLRSCIALDYRGVCGEVATEGTREVPLCERHWLMLRSPLELGAESAFLERRAAAEIEWREGRRQRQRAEGVVYYIRRGDGLIKIGTSANMPFRLQMLTIEHGPIEVLATEPGSYDEERIRHDQFADWRVEGEWFTPARELLDHIARLAAREHPPLAVR